MIKLFEKYDKGIYRIIKIFGIKITTKPFKNKLNAILETNNKIINQNENLLTYMKNINNVTVNYLFSIKKELAELKGNAQGKNKKAIYTCITNRYDNLFVHTYINNDWDYICFTDDKYLIDAKMYGNWIIKPLCNYGGVNTDNTRKSRWHKLHPHVVLKDYDYSLWIDSNIDIKTSYIFECIDKARSNNIDISIPPHYERDCIYDEANIIIQDKIDDKNIVNKQIKLYREEGFPEHYGLNETNIMYRNHNRDKIISLMEEWWQFIENYSKRDQLSLSYVLWKNNMGLNYLTDTNIRLDTKNFEAFHHNKDTIISVEELYKKYGLSL